MSDENPRPDQQQSPPKPDRLETLKRYSGDQGVYFEPNEKITKIPFKPPQPPQQPSPKPSQTPNTTENS